MSVPSIVALSPTTRIDWLPNLWIPSPIPRATIASVTSIRPSGHVLKINWFSEKIRDHPMFTQEKSWNYVIEITHQNDKGPQNHLLVRNSQCRVMRVKSVRYNSIIHRFFNSNFLRSQQTNQTRIAVVILKKNDCYLFEHNNAKLTISKI